MCLGQSGGYWGKGLGAGQAGSPFMTTHQAPPGSPCPVLDVQSLGVVGFFFFLFLYNWRIIVL